MPCIYVDLVSAVQMASQSSTNAAREESDDEGMAEEEEEEEEGTLASEHALRKRTYSHKTSWTQEEDRAMLKSYFK